MVQSEPSKHESAVGPGPRSPFIDVFLGFLAFLTTVLDRERDQWIIWIAVAFGFGAALYFSLENEPYLIFGPAMLLALTCLIYALPRHTLITVTLGLALSVMAGFTVTDLKTQWVRAPALTAPTRAVKVEGTIEQIEPRPHESTRLTITPSRIAGIPKSDNPRRVRITLNAKLAVRMGDIATGNKITVRAKLNPPPGPSLPGGYDFARYAWYRGIGAVGYALEAPRRINETPHATFMNLNQMISRARRAIGHRIERALPGETGAIANALITGERGAISEKTNNAYRGAGLYHILSISGLHMAIMGGAVFFVLRTLLALSPAIALNHPIKKWAAGGAIAGSFAYLMISGGAFATIRSFIMILIMFLAILVDRPAIALRNVALAALVILCLYPESILSPGFQMSFAAVTALTAGFEALKRRMPTRDGTNSTTLWRWLIWPFAAIILSTVIASAAVAPFAIYHFHNAQHYAVLSNLIAMPACNLIVMPAALASLIAMPFGLEALPLFVMGFGIDLMTKTATWIASLPGAVSHPPAIADHVFYCIIIGGIVLLIVRQLIRLVGLALIAIGISMAPGTSLPDILIGRDADLIAVKTSHATLAAHVMSTPFVQNDKPHNRSKTKHNSKNPPFELVRWMQYFGERRPPEAALATRIFHCDRIGCTVRKSGLLVALPNHPAAYRQDCARAQIMVTNKKAPLRCVGPQTIIDKYSVRRYGTHAIYIDELGAITIKTVAQSRGHRPWVHD